jgi:glycosyltransferase involved in cell wall biosynthesis
MISVVINTYNAEAHLEECLKAVKDFDEVIVCDMESTDQTVEIAGKHGCRVVTFPKDGHRIVEPARNFAIHQATHSWTLVVDADEIVTPALRRELYKKSLLEDGPAGYYISRRNKVMGVFDKNAGHDYILRFFQQEKTTWAPVIHSVPQVEGVVERLSPHYELIHLADENWRGWVSKMNDYTDYEASRKADRHFGTAALFLRPLWRFAKSFLFMGGFRNGRRGLLQAFQWAIYQQVLVAKMMEKRLRKKNE